MIIYDKDTLIEKLKIKEEFRYEIKSLIQIKNKNIIASSEKEIKIFKFYENNTKYEILNILKGHNSSINKVIELKNENLISCSSDCSIIIWKKMNKENDYNKQIEVLNEENGPIYSLLEIDDKIVSLHNENDYAIIWNYEIMEKIKFIYDIELNLFSNIFLFTERNNIIISGKGIYIINTKNFEITHRYYSKNYEYSCLFKIDSNSFLIGKNKIYSNESSSSIEQWDFNKEKNKWIIEKKIDTIYQDEINVLIYIKNQKKIMSSSDNSKIHFYQ
jgi:WD40 repeat protein